MEFDCGHSAVSGFIRYGEISMCSECERSARFRSFTGRDGSASTADVRRPSEELPPKVWATVRLLRRRLPPDWSDGKLRLLAWRIVCSKVDVRGAGDSKAPALNDKPGPKSGLKGGSMETKQKFVVGDWVRLDGTFPAIVGAVGGDTVLIQVSGRALAEEVSIDRLNLVFKH
jgi:hypothetical protein